MRCWLAQLEASSSKPIIFLRFYSSIPFTFAPPRALPPPLPPTLIELTYVLPTNPHLLDKLSRITPIHLDSAHIVAAQRGHQRRRCRHLVQGAVRAARDGAC